MIPYDDLVIALQTWRAKQGLPVAQLSGALTPPPQVAPPIAAAAPRSAPPVAPPGRGYTTAPPPLAAPDDAEGLDVDDSALLEEAAYEPEGGDFAVGFGGHPHAEEATAIGSAPRASDMTLDETVGPGRDKPGREDW